MSAKKARLDPEVDRECSDDYDESSDEEVGISRHLRHMKIRQKMYQLAEEVSVVQKRVDHGDDDLNSIGQVVHKYCHADILKPDNRDLINGRDLAVDSVVGDRLSRLLVHKVGKLSSNASKFNMIQFASKYKELGNYGDYYRKHLTDVFYKPAALNSVVIWDLNALEKPKEAAKEKEPRVRSKKAELVTVKGKQSSEIHEETDTSLMAHLGRVKSDFKRALKRFQTDRIRYYEFVVDPNSYGRTIENCFYVAFLLKDGEMFLDRPSDDDHPVLRKLTSDERAAKEEARDGGKPLPTNQCINTLTYAKWLGLINDLKITTALITST